MTFASKKEATKKDGTIKKGFKEVTGKDGRIRYLTEKKKEPRKEPEEVKPKVLPKKTIKESPKVDKKGVKEHLTVGLD
jgi:hypothetical protein